MAFLARGGFLPVITPTLMGTGFILVGWFVDPLYGVAPTLGVLMLMLAAFFANFWRDPDRAIPRRGKESRHVHWPAPDSKYCEEHTTPSPVHRSSGPG